jgi:hypothetical protein
MSEWISVKDQLPESDKYVLLFVPNEDPKIISGCLRTYREDYIHYVSSLYEAHFRPHNITHWQPLPSPPDQGESHE